MGTMLSKSADVIGFIKEQHSQIKQLFEEVLASNGAAREQKFVELRRLLAVHETAEEEIVHPMARRAIPDGETIVSARLAEENEAKKVLSGLEKLSVDSEQFEATFRQFKASVIAHAEAEETQELASLAGDVEPSKLQSMKRAAELAERIAPTRPHSGVESAAANILTGPFVAMIDRVRDAVSGKSAGK